MEVLKIKKYYDELLKISKYLSKVGPVRRQRDKASKRRFIQARNIYNEFKVYDQNVQSLSDISVEQVEAYIAEVSKIDDIYTKIESYCSEVKIEDLKNSSSGSSSSSSSSSEDETEKMASFDLKTAIGLIPVMDDTEKTTKQIISAIEMYETLLDATSKPTLINFVLKTRLSESAKMRLSQSYDTIPKLITDIKLHLLTKKSSTSLQTQLIQQKQGSMSLDNYAKTIEELFVELTISQADGNESTYSVLKPINEKLAIKRFADGLRDKRLGTILAARNCTTLKDAVRAAKDEELSAQTTSDTQGMVLYGRKGEGRFRGRPPRTYGYRGRGNSQYQQRPRPTGQPTGNNWRSRNNNFGYQNRGARYFRNSRGNRANTRGIHYFDATGGNDEQAESGTSQVTEPRQFFRL